MRWWCIIVTFSTGTIWPPDSLMRRWTNVAQRRMALMDIDGCTMSPLRKAEVHRPRHPAMSGPSDRFSALRQSAAHDPQSVCGVRS